MECFLGGGSKMQLPDVDPNSCPQNLKQKFFSQNF